MRKIFACAGATCLWATMAQAAPAHLELQTNQQWELFSAPANDADRRRILLRAAQMLGDRPVNLAGVKISPKLLQEIAQEHAGEPLLRTARELLRRPVDLTDFLLFLDDLLLASARGLPKTPIIVPPGRARNAGILLHPHDIFKPERAKHYGKGGGTLLITPPTSQKRLRPAKNGAVVGPRWAARYRQPQTERARLRALARRNPGFASRISKLTEQLSAQGAWVHIESTVRKRERGFLIFGSYWLSKAESSKQLRRRIRRLNTYERRWGLRVPIRWKHPRGWRATVRAAGRLAETYGVDYATKTGARKSDHYDGLAVDLWAVDLPRQVRLQAPDGSTRTFDLSAANEPRDLSLTPVLIDWIEAHFMLKKLRGDYPHWGDRPLDEDPASQLEAPPVGP